MHQRAEVAHQENVIESMALKASKRVQGSLMRDAVVSTSSPSSTGPLKKKVQLHGFCNVVPTPFFLKSSKVLTPQNLKKQNPKILQYRALRRRLLGLFDWAGIQPIRPLGICPPL